MVKTLNGLYKIRHDRFLIEINIKTLFTAVYVRDPQATSIPALRAIGTFDDEVHSICCLYRGLDIIYEYNKRHSKSV